MAPNGAVTPPGRSPEPKFEHLPPWLFPPRGAGTVDRTQQSGSVAAGASATVCSFEVPGGEEFSLRQIGFGALDPTALAFGTFGLRVNGDPVHDYWSIPVAIGSLDQPASVDLVVAGKALVELVVTNNAPLSAWVFIGRMRGWTFRSTLG